MIRSRPSRIHVRSPRSVLASSPRLAAMVAASFFIAADANAQPTCTGDWYPSSSTWAPIVDAAAELPGGDVILGGEFTIAAGAPADYIVRWNPITDNTSPLGSGVNGYVRALLVLPDGDIVAGGDFTIAGTSPALRIARWDSATDTWSPMGPGFTGDVTALATLPTGEIIAGGGFPLSRWDPVEQTWISLGAMDYHGLPGNGNPWALAVVPGGDIIAGGFFDAAAGVPANAIARCNPTTREWSALGSGVGGVQYPFVYALANMLDGRLAAAGYFATAGGIRTGPVAIWDPAAATWSSPGDGIAAGTWDRIRALAVLKNGDLVAGGDVLGVWRPGADAWSPLPGGRPDRQVYALTVLESGDLIIGGSRYVGRWVPPSPNAITITKQPVSVSVCPTGDAAFEVVASGGGAMSYQWQVSNVIWSWTDLTQDPVTLHCGAVATASQPTSSRTTIAIRPCTTDPIEMYSVRVVVTSPLCQATSAEKMYWICRTDINCNGLVSVQDLFDFLTAYFSLDPRADFNAQGGISVDDIFDYLAAYFVGCP